MLVKIKQEEIGELTIRKDIAEKKVANSDTKLANTIRDYEQTVQKLQVSYGPSYGSLELSRRQTILQGEQIVILLSSVTNFWFGIVQL